MIFDVPAGGQNAAYGFALSDRHSEIHQCKEFNIHLLVKDRGLVALDVSEGDTWFYLNPAVGAHETHETHEKKRSERLFQISPAG